MVKKHFNKLNIPTHWEQYWSKYPNGYSIMEALIDWVSQVDDMVDTQNDLSDTVSDYREELDGFIVRFDGRLQEEVTDLLKDWQDTGFLDVVIDQALDTKYHEMDNRLTAQLTQTAESNSINVLNPPAPFLPLENNGVDISNKLQNIVNNLNGRPIIIPNGNYGVSTTIELRSNSQIILHPNARMKTISNTKNIFSAFGTKKQVINVSSDLVKGNKSIPLSSTSALSVGDMVMVRDDKQLMNNVSKSGEVHFIARITGEQVILTEPLWDSYLVDRNVKLDIIEPKENISIIGGIIEGNGHLASQFSAMEFRYCKNVQIKNVHIKNWAERGIMLSTVIYGVVENCVFENIFDNTFEQSPTGYSVELSEATQWVDTITNFAVNVNKLWDVSGEATRHGHVRFCNVINNKVYGSKRGAISTHACGEYFDIYGNTIYGSNNEEAGTGHSIYLRTPNARIFNNTIYDSVANAIDVRTEGREGYFEIFGNTIHNSGNHGIRLSPSNTVDKPTINGHLMYAIVKDNQIINSRNGVFVTGNEAQSEPTKNITIEGNTILNAISTGITVTSSRIDFDDLVVRNNLINSTNDGILLNPSGGKYLNNPLFTGNKIEASKRGIRTEIQSRTVDAYVTNNYIKSELAISGFKADDVINNKEIIV